MRTSRETLAFLVVSFLAWAAGCHSSASSPAGQGAAGGDASADAPPSSIDADLSTAEGFCNGLYQIAGEVIGRCYGIPPARAQRLLAYPMPCQRFAASVAAGRTRYDPARAAACLAVAATMAATASCDGGSQATPINCDAVTPLVPPGGTCRGFRGTDIASECMGDNYCRQGTGPCDGICTARVRLGQPCDTDADQRCVVGATCDSVTKLCVADVAKTEGQACNGGGQPGCAHDLFCDLGAADGGSAGACRAQKTSGPCQSDLECALPSRCAGPSNARTCTQPRPAGQSCTPGQLECWGYCGAQNVCIEADATIGQACGAQNGEYIACEPDAYCDGSLLGAGACRIREQPGDACDPTVLYQCGGSFGACDRTAKTCLACSP